MLPRSYASKYSSIQRLLEQEMHSLIRTLDLSLSNHVQAGSVECAILLAVSRAMREVEHLLFEE
jgi:hypothetical protein